MFEKSDIVDDRFTIVSRLSEGGMGITYLSERVEDKKPVVLKCLHIERLKDWKSMELFKREASVLKSIHHPFIPAYIDFFENGTGRDLSFILVQEFIPGINLQKKADRG